MDTSRPEEGMARSQPNSGGQVAGVLLGAVLVVFTAQFLLNAVLAPLSRDLGLSEYQLGLVITVAAATFTVASIVWGRLCDRWGTREVLLAGLLTSAAGLGLFAAVCSWAVASSSPSGVVVIAMMATRSALFGIGLGAVTVAALAHGGRVHRDAAGRTRFVARIGAAQAAAQVLGPGLGGLLALGDLLAPVYLAPALLVVAAVAVGILLPSAPRATDAASADPIVEPLHPGGIGRRVLPFLITGFLLFLSLSVLQIVLGFLLQDRLDLDARSTAGAIGISGVVTGVVLIAVQVAVVPRLGWGPVRLVAVGAAVAGAGFLAVAAAPSLWAILVGLVVVTVGLGLGIPGYTAGTGLGLPASLQGRVAGLVNATNGTTYVAGPLLGTVLYGWAPQSPILVCAALCAVCFLVAVTRVRAPAPAG